MNRRHFVGQIVLGSTFLASNFRPSHLQAARVGGLTLKFVGMMGFVRRSDASILVALPGHHRLGHFAHVPFLMARTGSRVASSLNMTRMPGVAAGAFDDRLVNEAPDAFVYRCLDGTDMEVATSGAVEVDNQATQLAQMHRIAPGRPLRGNLRRWAHATVSLQGGRLSNGSAHPDAGKVFSFGSYEQSLTDAATYFASSAILRLASGAEVSTFAATDDDGGEMWVVSAAGPRMEVGDPKRLEHGHILFEYLDGASPVTAYCAEATGRITMATELPCAPAALASRVGGATPAYPPMVELCYNAFFDGRD